LEKEKLPRIAVERTRDTHIHSHGLLIFVCLFLKTYESCLWGTSIVNLSNFDVSLKIAFSTGVPPWFGFSFHMRANEMKARLTCV